MTLGALWLLRLNLKRNRITKNGTQVHKHKRQLSLKPRTETRARQAKLNTQANERKLCACYRELRPWKGPLWPCPCEPGAGPVDRCLQSTPSLCSGTGPRTGSWHTLSPPSFPSVGWTEIMLIRPRCQVFCCLVTKFPSGGGGPGTG